MERAKGLEPSAQLGTDGRPRTEADIVVVRGRFADISTPPADSRAFEGSEHQVATCNPALARTRAPTAALLAAVPRAFATGGAPHRPRSRRRNTRPHAPPDGPRDRAALLAADDAPGRLPRAPRRTASVLPSRGLIALFIAPLLATAKPEPRPKSVHAERELHGECVPNRAGERRPHFVDRTGHHATTSLAPSQHFFSTNGERDADLSDNDDAHATRRLT